MSAPRCSGSARCPRHEDATIVVTYLDGRRFTFCPHHYERHVLAELKREAAAEAEAPAA